MEKTIDGAAQAQEVIQPRGVSAYPPQDIGRSTLGGQQTILEPLILLTS